jgi:hypothetical protein
MEEQMNDQSTAINSQAQNQQSWLILFLRWPIGGFAGILISSWFYFGLINHATAGSFFWFGEILSSVVGVPFVGHVYLFYPYTISFLHITDFFVTFPVLIWGLIGALLASGRKNQITIGKILLVLYIIVGCVSFFGIAIMIPT